MARPFVRGLTENELAIMQTLWDQSPLSIFDILERLKKKPKPAYNSVLTLVRILEKKGHVAHQKEGKAFLYSPVLQYQNYRQSEVKRLISSLFQGNIVDLAVSLVKTSDLTQLDRHELKRLLEEL